MFFNERDSFELKILICLQKKKKQIKTMPVEILNAEEVKEKVHHVFSHPNSFVILGYEASRSNLLKLFLFQENGSWEDFTDSFRGQLYFKKPF